MENNSNKQSDGSRSVSDGIQQADGYSNNHNGSSYHNNSSYRNNNTSSRRGRGGRGRGGGHRGGRGGHRSNVCRFFLRGNCKHGENCRHSHDVSGQQQQQQQQPRNQQQLDPHGMPMQHNMYQGGDSQYHAQQQQQLLAVQQGLLHMNFNPDGHIQQQQQQQPMYYGQDNTVFYGQQQQQPLSNVAPYYDPAQQQQIYAQQQQQQPNGSSLLASWQQPQGHSQPEHVPQQQQQEQHRLREPSQNQDPRQQQQQQQPYDQKQQKPQQQSHVNQRDFPQLGDVPSKGGRQDMPTDFRYDRNSSGNGNDGGDWRDNPRGGRGGGGRSGGLETDFRKGGRNNHGNAKRTHRMQLEEYVYEKTGERFRAGVRDKGAEERLFGKPKSGINFAEYNEIDVEVSGSNPPLSIKTFLESKMHPLILDNIELAHFESPTPIQLHSLPIVLASRDLMACAQTGSGKTGAFLFPLINKLLNHRSSRGGRTATPTGLILAPTRELAVQINMEAEKFLYRSDIRNVVVYGGQNQHEQRSALSLGCDILVATPGRLMDFVDRRYISLDNVSYFVLDEADRMLDMGFEIQIREIVDRMPQKHCRQTLMFSATFPTQIQRLAADFLDDYMFIAVGRVGSSSGLITQKLLYVDDKQKQDRLIRCLAECEGLTLVFVETKRAADSLEGFLWNEGIEATSIHGDREQAEREEALAMFRSGRCPVLVATDVAARGLDIPNVSDVFNYDMPNTIDDYVHRIGRTGRAGHKGTSTTFVNERNRGIFSDLFKVLEESEQEIPSWFTEMLSYSSSSSSSRGNNRRGGKQKAETDFRRGERPQENKSNNGAKGKKKKGGGGGGGFSQFGGGVSKGGSYANDAW